MSPYRVAASRIASTAVTHGRSSSGVYVMTGVVGSLVYSCVPQVVVVATLGGRTRTSLVIALLVMVAVVPYTYVLERLAQRVARARAPRWWRSLYWFFRRGPRRLRLAQARRAVARGGDPFRALLTIHGARGAAALACVAGSTRSFRKHRIDAEDYIGVHGDEPYALFFKNYTRQRVEVCFSVDGTDVITGRPADLEPATKRWVVGAYATCELEAWPESKESGGRFVFAQAGKSVAAHTHGDVSHLGVLAAAVFVESAPQRPLPVQYDSFLGEDWGGGMKGGGGHTFGGPMRGGPGTGVGSRVDQRIGSVQGLERPRLAHVLRVRYLWQVDLDTRLRRPAQDYVPGFPKSKVEAFRGVDLSGVPRTETDDPRFTNT